MDVLLVRAGAEIRAYSAKCPHAGAPLEEGAVCQGRIVCPWHKAAFRIEDGALAEPPALEPLKRFAARREGEDVLVGGELAPPAGRSRGGDARTFAILGAGAAGAAAAAALREFGFGGRIQMIGSEPGAPFDRTSLSKFVVAGQMKPADAPLLRPASFYQENAIERVDAEILQFDARSGQISLSDGRRLLADAALIATGGDPHSLVLLGAEIAGVHLLRTREDACEILKDARKGARAVVVGAGFIGLEVASALRARECEVTVVTPEMVPLSRIFGARIGGAVRTLHENNGVTFVLGAKPRRLSGRGRVEQVELADGRNLDADVVGLGIRPSTRFIGGIKLQHDGGVAVGRDMRAAGAVFAAGDVAAFLYGPNDARIRVEHWRVAQQHARVAAANMIGGHATYDAAPFFWTYHYGRNFEYIGHASRWDEEVVVGDPEATEFLAFYLQGDRVAAIAACNRQRATAALVERMGKSLPLEEALALARAI